MRMFIAGLAAAISLAVAAGPAAAQRMPAVESSGAISVGNSQTFDLDDGSVGSGSGDDVWLHAVSSTERYLEPRGRAQISVGDGSNRDFPGCAIAQYSATRVALSAIPVGSFVCVLTDEGRISQFRRTANLTQNRLTLRYTTWALQPFP